MYAKNKKSVIRTKTNNTKTLWTRTCDLIMALNQFRDNQNTSLQRDCGLPLYKSSPFSKMYHPLTCSPCKAKNDISLLLNYHSTITI